jgi:hypothetical protein
MKEEIKEEEEEEGKTLKKDILYHSILILNIIL